MKWFNNGKVNVRRKECPEGFVPGRLPFTRKRPTKETRKRMSESHKGQIAWNKGKRNPYNQDTLDRMSESAKKRGMSHIDNRGREPWNKGLSYDEHESIRIYAIKQRGQNRKGEYRCGEMHPCWNPQSEYYKRFRKRVDMLTEQIYAKHVDKINPEGLPRTRAGVEGGYQLDHILSVSRGFEIGMDPEEIASVDNLQMLPWAENVKKGNK